MEPTNCQYILIEYQKERTLLSKTCNYFHFYSSLYRNSLEKIPCATVLLRCIKAPMDGPKALGLRDVDMREWKNVGVIVDPNDYSEGRYNT